MAALVATGAAVVLAQGESFAPGESLRPPARPVAKVAIAAEADPPISEDAGSNEAGSEEAGSEEAAEDARHLVILSSKSPAPRPETLLRGHEFRIALSLAARGEWEQAKRLAAQDSAVAADIIEWQRLRGGLGSFDEYRAFLARHGDWPGLKLLRRKGEASIQDKPDADAVIAYFAKQPPQTGYGALKLAEAWAAKGDFRASRKVLIEAWRSMEMSAEEEARYLAAHGEALAPFHADRLDDALWRKDRPGARRMLALVPEDARKLAEARLALQGRTKAADRLWRELPDAMQADPGLARDRMEWLIAQRRRDQAADLMLAQSSGPEALGRPEAWANWRRILARQAMRDGKHKRAYDLASAHFLESGSDYADLEWLSGYLALRFLDRPSAALTHFRRFRAAVDTPISLGRAGYWEGRALQAMGEMDLAERAYRDAARHQTSFYGLLAAEKLGLTIDPALTGAGEAPDWRGTRFARSSVFAAANLFHKAGNQWEVTRFLRQLAENADEEELVALADYTLSLENPYISVRVGKQVAREGAVAHRSYYPLADLGAQDLPVPAALALAIARRESEFYVAAVSGAGARGLMQLMPGTARQMAAKLEIPFELGRLTRDPVYNATLGSAYLAHLIEEFGNNLVLVAVGYNAGPQRARSWIEQFGDPRDPGVDVVDWIEHIPFRETRNYVMRVAESVVVYRARLSGKVEPVRLTDELKAK